MSEAKRKPITDAEGDRLCTAFLHHFATLVTGAGLAWREPVRKNIAGDIELLWGEQCKPGCFQVFIFSDAEPHLSGQVFIGDRDKAVLGRVPSFRRVNVHDDEQLLAAYRSTRAESEAP
jgi:hypothetical protein